MKRTAYPKSFGLLHPAYRPAPSPTALASDGASDGGDSDMAVAAPAAGGDSAMEATAAESATAASSA
eukprot:5607871-Prymnesium_polylepis.1